MNVFIICIMYVIACMLNTILLGLGFFQIKFWENHKPRKMWAWDSKMSQALAQIAGAVSSTESVHDLDTLAVKPWIYSEQDGIYMILAILLKSWNGLMDLKQNFQGRQDHKLTGSHVDYKHTRKNPDLHLVIKNLEISEIRRMSGELLNSPAGKPDLLDGRSRLPKFLGCLRELPTEFWSRWTTGSRATRPGTLSHQSGT